MRHTTIILVIILASLSLIQQPALAENQPLPAELQELSDLTRQIDAKQAEIAGLDGQLEQSSKDIIATYQRLENAQANFGQRRLVLNSRFVDVYKNYDFLVLSLFVESRSFADVWKGIAFLARINAADEDLLAANRKQLETVRQIKQELVAKKRAQVDLRRQKLQEFRALEVALLEKKLRLEAVASANQPTYGQAFP